MKSAGIFYRKKAAAELLILHLQSENVKKKGEEERKTIVEEKVACKKSVVKQLLPELALEDAKGIDGGCGSASPSFMCC